MLFKGLYSFFLILLFISLSTIKTQTKTIDCAHPEVTSSSSIHEIKKAYKDFVLKCHPDKRGDYKEAHDEFVKGQAFYNSLFGVSEQPKMQESPFYSFKKQDEKKTFKGFASPLDKALAKAARGLNRAQSASLLAQGARVTAQSLVNVIEWVDYQWCITHDYVRPMLFFLIEHIDDPNMIEDVVKWQECFESYNCRLRETTFSDYLLFKMQEKKWDGDPCVWALSIEEVRAIVKAVDAAKDGAKTSYKNSTESHLLLKV